ncbi:MAG: hypothetical protein ACRDF9_03865 [Candidatus Limnocylindria bacterium]
MIVLVANFPVVRELSLSTATTEIAWGAPLGVVAGAAAVSVARLVAQRAWPLPAFGSCLIWTSVLALLLGLYAVPPLFAASAALAAFGTTAVVGSRTRPRVAPGLARAILAGSGGFSVFVIALVLVLMAATRSRPSGVGFGEWRRYMDAVDLLGVTAVALGAGAALVLGLLADRRMIAGPISLLAFGALFLVAAPFLGFLSACYAGEVLRVFGWLTSPTC